VKTYNELLEEIKKLRLGGAIMNGVSFTAPIRSYHVSGNNNGMSRIETVDAAVARNWITRRLRPRRPTAPALWLASKLPCPLHESEVRCDCPRSPADERRTLAALLKN